MQPTKIVQVLPCYSQRDAIGTHALNIKSLLEKRGFSSGLFVELFYGDPLTTPLESLGQDCDQESIIIYHYSTGSHIPRLLLDIPGYKVCCYHNITPPYFFAEPDEAIIRGACQTGRLQMGLVAQVSHAVWADSHYNALELEHFGFPKAQILPILRDYFALQKLQPDAAFTASLMSHPRKNLLFVGRMAPNKAHHDLIITYGLYRKHINPNVRLILAGTESQGYGKKLRQLCVDLRLKVGDGVHNSDEADVVFLGSVNDEILATCYHLADCFLCLSDHEGYCVPILEAMAFGVPVVAHQSTVLPETCAGAALLVDKNNTADLMTAIHTALHETDRKMWIDRGKQRMAEFDWPQLAKAFYRCLEHTLNDFQNWRQKGRHH